MSDSPYVTTSDGHRPAATFFHNSSLHPWQPTDVAEPDQAAVRFVPELQVDRFPAFPEGHRRHGGEKGMRLMAVLQVIVRDLGTQVVDVMEADVSAEPLQDLRQLII